MLESAAEPTSIERYLPEKRSLSLLAFQRLPLDDIVPNLTFISPCDTTMNTNIEKATAGRLDMVRWINIPSHSDSRGVLTAVESGQDIPFEIRRVYMLHHIVDERGGHAHRDTQQLVIANSGSFEIVLSDGTNSRSFLLDDPTRGLLIGSMLYIRMKSFTPDVRAVIIASTHYDCARSIRSWDDYLTAIAP